jgi:syntaxin 1B/2/3
VVSTQFVEALQNHQSVEQQYRARYKQRLERQFRIGISKCSCFFFTSLTNSEILLVKPDATPEEVAAVVEEQDGGNKIFAQAVCKKSLSPFNLP